jgi:hypothetical protein
MDERLVLLEQLADQVAKLRDLATAHRGTYEGELFDQSHKLFAFMLSHFLDERDVLVGDGDMPWWQDFQEGSA